jgi:hypothetical protein
MINQKSDKAIKGMKRVKVILDEMDINYIE